MKEFSSIFKIQMFKDLLSLPRLTRQSADLIVLITFIIFSLMSLFSCSKNSKELRVAKGAGQGVYYSLFVRSFADSDGDGIGDLKGICSKLDYIESLGITGIWLLPIMPSHSYHGYDVDDYYSINPQYGTMQDFELLLAECKKRSISLIIDMPFNHSSVHNEWFVASRNPDDAHHSWYRWIEASDSRYNTNTSAMGHKLWNEDQSYKGNFYAGEFSRSMPDFNHDNPEVRAEFKKVMKFWLDKGVDGFRFDAAGHLYDLVKLPAGTSDGTSRAVEFWKEMVLYCKSVNPGCYCVGEVWDSSGIRAQYMTGIFSCFHFDMGDKYIISQINNGNSVNNSFALMMEKELDRYGQFNAEFTDAPFLTNHDQARAGGLLKGDLAKLKLAASMYILCQGVPFVYYGEELGMKSGALDQTKRTPLLWDKSIDGLPQSKIQTTWASEKDCIYNKETLPVSVQEKDKNSLLNFYRRLIKFRNSRDSFVNGKFAAYSAKDLANGDSSFDASLLSCWTMESEKECSLVLNNLGGKQLALKLDESWGKAKVVFSTDGKKALVKKGELCIPACSTLVLLLEK